MSRNKTELIKKTFLGNKIYSFNDAPNIDFIKDINEIIWWSEKEICIKEKIY